MTLTRYDNNSVELVIGADGEVFYPGYRSLARVCSIGLEKPVYDTQVKRIIESTSKGATTQKLLTAEILTAGGIQGATLIPRRLGSPAIKKYNRSEKPMQN